MLEHNEKAAKRIRKQYIYNPGVSPYDLYLDKYAENPKNHYFIKHGDPISSSLLYHTKPKNLKILTRNMHYDPVKNHTIDNFLTDLNNIPVPKNGEVKYNKNAKYPEIKGNPHDLVDTTKFHNKKEFERSYHPEPEPQPDPHDFKPEPASQAAEVLTEPETEPETEPLSKT